MRPRKVKLFLPPCGRWSNEPLRVFQRVHALPRRLERAADSHLPPTLRPVVLRWTVNLTELVSDKLNETLVLVPVAAIDAPDFGGVEARAGERDSAEHRLRRVDARAGVARRAAAVAVAVAVAATGGGRVGDDRLPVAGMRRGTHRAACCETRSPAAATAGISAAAGAAAAAAVVATATATAAAAFVRAVDTSGSAHAGRSGCPAPRGRRNGRSGEARPRRRRTRCRPCRRHPSSCSALASGYRPDRAGRRHRPCPGRFVAGAAVALRRRRRRERDCSGRARS